MYDPLNLEELHLGIIGISEEDGGYIFLEKYYPLFTVENQNNTVTMYFTEPINYPPEDSREMLRVFYCEEDWYEPQA